MVSIIYRIQFLEIKKGSNRSLLINDVIYQSGFEKRTLEEDIAQIKIMVFEAQLYTVDQLLTIYSFLNGLTNNHDKPNS